MMMRKSKLSFLTRWPRSEKVNKKTQGDRRNELEHAANIAEGTHKKIEPETGRKVDRKQRGGEIGREKREKGIDG